MVSISLSRRNTAHTAAPSCLLPEAARRAERRGRLWLAMSWLCCPCHLPLSLGLLAFLLGGTALGAAIRDHAIPAGIVLTAVWVLGTARGFMHLRTAKRCSSCRETASPPTPSPLR
jgi:mercuric ion transport protein